MVLSGENYRAKCIRFCRGRIVLVQWLGIKKARVLAEDKESRRGAGLRTDVMERYEEEGEDSDNETDPEQLLNEWLGELDSLTVVSSFSLVNIAATRSNRCGEEASRCHIVVATPVNWCQLTCNLNNNSAGSFRYENKKRKKKKDTTVSTSTKTSTKVSLNYTYAQFRERRV